MQEKKAVLTETVKVFGQQEWFRDATIYDQHPNTGEPTLEFKVNYVPILGLCQKHYDKVWPKANSPSSPFWQQCRSFRAATGALRHSKQMICTQNRPFREFSVSLYSR